MASTNKKLTVLLPTYNRSSILEKSLKAISCSVSNNVCILVLDNDSCDDTREIVAKYQQIDDRIKYIRNRINTGSSRTLYIGFLNVETDFFIILGDRDEPTTHFFEEVINTFEMNPTVGVFHAAYLTDRQKLPIQLSKMTSRSGLIRRGFSAMDFMFNASGAIHGIAFKTACVKNEYWILDGNLYPQTLIAGMVGLHYDAFYYISDWNYLYIGPGTTSLVETRKNHNRPNDWGVLERMKIAKKLIIEYNNLYSQKSVHDIISPLMRWAASLFRNMCCEDFNTAKKFLKSILEDECVAESHAFRHCIINIINSEQDKDVKYNMLKILEVNRNRLKLM